MRTIQTQIYTYDELDERAKEKARDWYRRASEGDNDFADSIIDDAGRIADILGVEFSTRTVRLMGGSTRQDPCVYWSLGYSQGDYASFAGQYRYSKGAAKRIREYAPQDKTLHRIAAELQAAQSRNFYRLVATIQDTNHGGMRSEVCDGENEYRDIGDAESEVRDALRAFADWIYESIRKEHEYQNSDETIAENIAANEYEFTADGERA